MRRKNSIRLLLLGAFAASAGLGQELGTISGTISDPSGAAIAASPVTLTETDTGLKRTALVL